MEPHVAGEAEPLHQVLEPRGLRRVAGRAAEAVEARAVRGLDRGERPQQQLVALARRQRRDAQQAKSGRGVCVRVRVGRGVAPGTVRCGHVGAGLDDLDLRGGHGVVALQRGGGLGAGDDDGTHLPERRAFGLVQLPRARGLEPGLVRERVVHQRDEPQPRPVRGGERGHCAEGEPVRQHQCAIGQRRERALGLRQRRRRRRRERRVERDHLDRPVARAQFLHHAAVVEVAAGGRVDVAGQQQRQRRRGPGRPRRRGLRTAGAVVQARRLPGANDGAPLSGPS